jgi:hypothetical protein
LLGAFGIDTIQPQRQEKMVAQITEPVAGKSQRHRLAPV